MMRIDKNTNIYKIVSLVKKKPMSTGQLYKKIGRSVDLKTFRVQITQCARNYRYIRTTNLERCKECFSKHKGYIITPHGLEMLGFVNMLARKKKSKKVKRPD